MALTTLTDDLDIIQALDDAPNDSGGLTAAQLKAKFDEGPNAIKTYLNDTLIPELDAAHLPYDNTVPDGQTIQEALDEATIGTLPDRSITEAKLGLEAVVTDETKALFGLAGTATSDDVFAVIANKKEFPHEVLTATWNEALDAQTTVTKSFSHTLGKAPSKVRAYFTSTWQKYTAMAEALYDGSTYNYSMSGHTVDGSNNSGGGAWKREMIDNPVYFDEPPLFGFNSTPDIYFGTYSLGYNIFSLNDITWDGEEISISIKNNHGSAGQTLSSFVVVEVFE